MCFQWENMKKKSTSPLWHKKQKNVRVFEVCLDYNCLNLYTVFNQRVQLLFVAKMFYKSRDVSNISICSKPSELKRPPLIQFPILDIITSIFDKKTASIQLSSLEPPSHCPET